MADTKFRIGLVNAFPAAPDSVCYIDVEDIEQALRIQHQLSLLCQEPRNPILALIEYFAQNTLAWTLYEKD